MFTVRCYYCKREHLSEFWDELEDGLLKCRDEAPHWQKGLLSEFEESHIITVETAASINNEDPFNIGTGGP